MPQPKARRSDLRALARPEGILLDTEWHRLSEFLELFATQLERICRGRAPEHTDAYAARKITAAIWKFDRNTADRDQEERIARTGSRELAWAETFRSHEVRARLNRLLQEEIEDAENFADAIRGSGTVIVDTVDTNREEVA